jgi:hypothetical protein
MKRQDHCAVPDCDRPYYLKGYCSVHYNRNIRHGSPTGGRPHVNGGLIQWVRDHVSHEGDDCLHWPFARHASDGRPLATLTVDGVKYHNPCALMLTLRAGPRPTVRHQAAHNCGKGHEGCVNPNHLRWATPKENIADKKIHGTQNHGANVGTAKLTEDQVRQILKAPRGTTARLARKFGVHVTQAYKIRRGDAWQHLSKPGNAREM